MILFSSLEKMCDGKVLQLFNDHPVQDLFIDSRKSVLTQQSVFFAIAGDRHNGHHYISGLYKAGTRQFVVEENINASQFPEANFLLVKSSRKALQMLAAYNRKSCNIPVIGITGSNGKTIIKEWLFQLLPDLKIVKNPGSYNSQVGVPLSVWNMHPHHELGIFEAGISRPGEMENLEKIIQPTIGIFSNIGSAHDEGFSDQQEKVREKLKLFTRTEILVCSADQPQLLEEINKTKLKTLTWGFNSGAHFQVSQRENKFLLKSHKEEFEITLPFSDKASVENILHCIVILRYLNYSPQIIQERIHRLRSVPMRLELKQGINNCQVIDDSYNNDLAGLQVGLDFLGSLPNKKTVILSDVLQSGLDDEALVPRISELLAQSGIDRFIAIGKILFEQQQKFDNLRCQRSFYRSTEDALSQFNWDDLNRETILVKGARSFQFERITARIQRKIHGTRMEIDLNKMVHNLNFFKSRLNPGVKVMVMVKAFAYGSGSEEVASLLQYHKVDYLGVAYADEGIELRKSQIHLPIMVMNPTEESFSAIISNNLEPVIYSVEIFNALLEYLQGNRCRIHLEIETGMHRLGLEQDNLEEVISHLKQNKNISIASIFSHLAGADDSNHDEYSSRQMERFESAYEKISSELNVRPIRHILNSSGILRFPYFQMDMVRLGIGLYGVNPTEESFDQLQPVATLKTVISQIKNIKEGESVGYGRWGKAVHDMKIATIAIGYADGFSRSFSKGAGSVLINGKRAPVFGNVCMDMTMVDITEIEAKEGDEVIVFGEGLTIHEVAGNAKTIPYEILTSTSERVKRIFFTDSF
ncbi:MAG: bifunctional UDP-N-acetylmuramoyl-tripeptide:D-alanyl-D-alanine ligase/alanine racemase [Cyclobacteriaceae bacterium]|nr:bifunctional UDP-N-acetylmuramoyl-tripeptide:D-alanyl-D-alanine ligase/alanine racemase [Cyclobacteriaceae bacterium]